MGDTVISRSKVLPDRAEEVPDLPMLYPYYEEVPPAPKAETTVVTDIVPLPYGGEISPTTLGTLCTLVVMWHSLRIGLQRFKGIKFPWSR